MSGVTRAALERAGAVSRTFSTALTVLLTAVALAVWAAPSAVLALSPGCNQVNAGAGSNGAMNRSYVGGDYNEVVDNFYAGETLTYSYAVADGGSAYMVITDFSAASQIEQVNNVASSGSGQYTILTSALMGVTINNTGSGTVDWTVSCAVPINLSVSNATLTEGNGGTKAFNFTVGLSGPAPAGGVTFDIATADGSATAGTDYIAANQTGMTIPAGATSATFAVLVTGDLLNESNEGFFVNVTNVVGATVSDAQGAGVITNDDPAPSISIGDVSVTEGDSGTSNMTFTVTLSAASGRPITVTYSTAAGTAVSPSDYTHVAATMLNFPAGVTSRTITVPIVGDLTVEADEAFVVNLSNAVNATIADNQATGTILNNDFSAPTVTAISPTAGPTAGGATVTITGTNFQTATAVTFGATAATGFTINSATQITATAPAGTGTVDVSVTSAGGTSATSPVDQYTFVNAPTVTAISPTAGSTAGGTTVTITGTNFQTATAVTFGATAATSFTINSATRITAVVPAGTGTVDIRVTTVGGTSATSAADQYTFVAAPTVTAISPASGPSGGGGAVTITGTGFTGATAVTFGATAATSFTVDSATQISAVAPAGTGTIDVRVTTPGGTSATSSADWYTFVATPVVSAISSTTGSAGTSVTITGTAFSTATAVTFGATPATSFTINSATRITAVAPAGAGVVDVRVTNPGGTSATWIADLFTYKASQTIGFTSTAPASARSAGPGYTPTATATSGLPVALTIDASASAVCAIAGGEVSFTAPGTCVINADQAGDAGHLAALQVQQSFTVGAPLAAPVVISPGEGEFRPTRDVFLAGTAQANATISITGSYAGSTTANGGGAWAVLLPAVGFDGPVSVNVTATDASGAVSPAATRGWIIDTMAPAAPTITAPFEGQAVNTRNPVIQGMTEPFAQVTIQLDGVSIAGVVADPSGAFSYTHNNVADGPHAIRAFATDRAANAGPFSADRTFTVDATVPAFPVLTSPAPGATIGGATPTLVGTAEPGDLVTVYLDDAFLAQVTADGSGGWTAPGSTPLTDGPHQVKLMARDSSFNSSGLSGPISFTVDAIAPGTPTIAAPANGSTTTVATPTISGSAEAGSTVVVTLDGSALPPATANGSGLWTVMTGTLADGAHTVAAVATDALGNASPASATASFAVDATAPSAPVILAPVNASVTSHTTITISGTAEAGSSVVVTLDGSPLAPVTADGSGGWTLTTAVLADGTHAITAIATDALGNASPASATTSFTVDATAPGAPTIAAPANGASTTDTTPTLSGSAEAGSTVVVTLDGSPLAPVTADGSGAWTLTTTVLADGSHTITATATDALGNVSPASAATSFTVDATAPAAPTITTPVDGAVTDDGTPMISGSTESGATVNLSIDGGAPVSIVATGGAWRYTPPSTLSAGPHTLSATATDDTGNISPASATVRFTYSPLAITTGSLPSGQVGVTYSSTISVAGGTAPYGFAVTGGALPGGVTLGGDGVLSGAPTTSGSYAFTVTATDGNALSASAAFTVTVAQPAEPAVTDVADVAVTANPNGDGQPTLIDLSTAVTNTARIEVVTPPAHGTATVSGLTVTYAPEAGYFGSDSFTYRAIGFTDGVSGGASARSLRSAALSSSPEATVTVRIAAPTLVLAGGAQPTGRIGVASSQTLAASGGTAPYAYAVTAGALPAGMSLAADGTLSGSPTASGAFSFTVTATDSSTGTGPFSVSTAYALTIDAPALSVTPAVLPEAMVAQAYSQAFAASGGTAPYSYAITGGAPPAGLSLSSAGVLSGMPTQGGSFSFTVSATDASTGAGPYTASQTVVLTVAGSSITVTPASLPPASRGTAYSQNVTASGGVAPYAYAVASGALPAGLTLSTTGAVSGTPTEAGTFTFQVRAVDSATGTGPYAGVASLTLTVNAAILTVTPTTLSDVLAGVTYSQQMQATGGQGTYTFAVTAGAPPQGITLSTAGVLGGRPVVAGVYAFTITATDGFSNTGSVALSLTVTGRPDPSADPDVRGLNTAQAEATRRLAGTQMSNFARRLEALHGGGAAQPAASLGLSLDGHAFTPIEQGRSIDELVYGLKDGRGRSDREELSRIIASHRTDLAMSGGEMSMGSRGPAGPTTGPRVWAGGAISLGERDPTTRTAKLSVTTSGLSAGIDFSVGPTLDLGLGAGFGQENTDVGSDVSRMKAKSRVGVAYGSWRPAEAVFVDGMVGYGALSFDMRRRTPVDGAVVFGEREGSTWFGSLAAGLDRRWGPTRLISYGRLERVDADLDAFTETGSPLWALSFEARGVESLQGTLGLRYEREIRRRQDRWTPGLRLEWRHEFADAGGQVLRYADWLDGPSYAIGQEGWDRSQLNLGVSLGWRAGDGWSWSGEYQGSFSDGETLGGLKITGATAF